MKKALKKAVETYQCTGCLKGSDTTCFKQKEDFGIGCGEHFSGTFLSNVGKIFLGMPKGFNRLGKAEDTKIQIYNSYEECDWKFDKFNIPVWKHLDENGNTLVRAIMPRRNEPFIHIFLENCLDKINCLEITKDDINAMD
jgi:hypothetical protein